MDTVIIVVASYFIAIPLSVVLYEFFTITKAEKIKFVALLLVGGLASLALAKIAHLLISDPRPFTQGHFKPLIVASHDNGFPSDHTLLAAFIGFVMLGRSHLVGGLLLVVALAIGLARMAAGVHHSWDILGSFIITAISYLFARWFVGVAIRRRNQASHH